MDQLSGGDMLIRALHDEGVEVIFGYPGGAVLHIYDAIFRQDKVEHILVRHEQAATHAADGYARASGKPGVVLVTSGPGATNAVTGLATAYMDSIPMVVISGQVESRMIGTDGFQETDMVGISRPIVKHSFMVQKAEDIPSVIKKAFYISKTGRPGPVVIDIPKDITEDKCADQVRVMNDSSIWTSSVQSSKARFRCSPYVVFQSVGFVTKTKTYKQKQVQRRRTITNDSNLDGRTVSSESGV